MYARYDLTDILDSILNAKMGDKDMMTIKFKDDYGIHYEYGDNNELIIDVPGYSKEDLNIYIEESTLFIEIGKDKITRKFNINKGFKVKDAECKNGQLTIYFEEIKKDVLKIDVK